MSDEFIPPPRNWPRKFAEAFRGIGDGVVGQPSFYVHIAVAIAVVVVAGALGVSRTDWCLLAGCIGMVITAELFNSALERVARAVDRHENEHLKIGLNIASGAVLVACITAAIIGFVVLAPPLFDWLLSLRSVD